MNLTRGLASEWGKYNINVNAICPGYFYSPLTKETLDSDFFQQNARTMIPLSRYGNEGELDRRDFPFKSRVRLRDGRHPSRRRRLHRDVRRNAFVVFG